MRKVLKLTESNLRKKVSVISHIAGINLSDSELLLLSQIVELSTNNQVTITPQISAHIRESIGITQSGFGTSLHRLAEKGAIRKNGRTIMLHPIYKDALLITELLIKLVNTSHSTE